MAEKKPRRFTPPQRRWTSIKPRCTGKRIDGEACNSLAHPKAPDQRCAHHTQDPDLRARQYAIASSGGRAQAPLVRALKVIAHGPYGPMIETLGEAMVLVMAGQLDPSRLSALSQGARALVNVVDAARGEDRADRLEEILRKAMASGAFAKSVGGTPDIVIRDAHGQDVTDVPWLETGEPDYPPEDHDGDPPHVRARRKGRG